MNFGNFQTTILFFLLFVVSFFFFLSGITAISQSLFLYVFPPFFSIPFPFTAHLVITKKTETLISFNS